MPTNNSNITLDNALSLAQAAKLCPTNASGKHPAPATLWRWARHGLKTPAGSVNLETVTFGKRCVTSREALNAFFDQLAEAQRVRGAA